MRPISQRFLNDSASYKPVTGKDAYGNPAFGATVPLKRFHAEAPKKTVINANGEQVDDRMVIYFDVVRSTPRGHNFVKGDYITYNGGDYIIREAQVFPTVAKPHHWEVRLT